MPRTLAPLLALLLLAACTRPDDKPAVPDDTADTDPGGEPGTVELGGACPLTSRLGEVHLLVSAPDVYLSARVFDRADPWIGPAELSTSTCAFHRFSTESCGTCDAGQVCGFDGACTPERRALTDVTLDLTVGGATQTFTANETTGDLYSAEPVGTVDDTYTIELSFGGQVVSVPALAVAGALPDVVVVGEGDSMAPGALDATWTPPAAEHTRVRTVIPINHHAAGPTFTSCDVAASAGALHADAPMMEPLAVVTGIEFQGIEHATSAAAYVEGGCVDIRAGTQSYDGVDWAAE